MSDPKAYRSSHPDVLAAWSDWQADRKAFTARVRAFADTHAEGRTTFVSVWAEEQSICGVSADGGDLPGWRASKRGHLVPDKRTKTGKAAAAAMGELRSPDPKMPGMPVAAMASKGGGIIIHSPRRIFQHDGAMWVQWSGEADVETTNRGRLWLCRQDLYDAAMWDRVPLAEFYAAVEAHKADR